MDFYDELPRLRLSDRWRVEWLCPRPGCLGVMNDTGDYLMIAGGAYVHACDVCSQKLAIRGVRFDLPSDD